ncbi:MAG: T9SS type A sorting domain-containing protein, partial [Saprospiraceae bacterium]
FQAMRHLLALLWVGISLPCLSQQVFNRAYEYGYPRNQFRNLIVHNDTIVSYGMARTDTLPHRQCLFVARLDSSGAKIDHTLICDPLGGTLAMDINWADMARTSDGGYALTASSITRNDGAFIKLRSDLSVEFVREYRDTVNFVEFFDAAIELSDGYLLGGYVQQPNYLIQSFLRRVDKQGNTLWFSYYGEHSVTDLFSDYLKINDSLIVFVGGYVTNGNTLSGRGPWIAFINPNDGEIIKEWRPENYLEVFLHFINPLPGNRWLLYGKRALQVNPLQVSPFWAIADSAFEIEDIRLFGPGSGVSNFLWDFAPTPDGNFIAAGQVDALNPNTEPAQVYGWLYKVSPGLDSLWSRKMIPPIAGTQGGFFGGVGVLSSGNMVAGGYCGLSNGAVQGWLVKFTPDGCVDTILCNTVPVWEPEEQELREPPARVYPNPTTGRFFVELPKDSGPVRVLVHSLDGRTVLEQTITTSVELDGTGLRPGLYFCRVVDATGLRLVAKLIISR